MALKFVQKGYGSGGGGSGGGSGTYDHNLLLNRGLPDQHTIESITGLRPALNKKYEKPFSGIPKADLAFNVATLHDLDVLRATDIADVNSILSLLATEVEDARGEESTLRQYIDTKISQSDWSGGTGGGTGGGHLESQIGYPLYQEFRAIEGQTLFTFNNTYRKGTRQLEVYLDGLRMIQGDDYIEVDEQNIEFLFPINQDSLVVGQVRAVINSGLHEEYHATNGQTLFPLVSPYGLHQNILQVYRNGVLQRKGRDYREIDNQNVEFIYPLNSDDYITFHQSGATDPIAGTLMESEIGRVKINLALTTMQLHDMTGTDRTDYTDMYVDTFITTWNVDEEKSFEYLYENREIKVGLIERRLEDYEDYQPGTRSDTDIDTYPSEIRLVNQSGGSEAHTFNPYTNHLTGVTVIDSFALHNKYHKEFYFYVEDDGVNRFLRMKVDTSDILINTTDGYFFKIYGKQDHDGNIHIVYHEQSASIGLPRVHYGYIQNEDYTLYHDVISDSSYEANSPHLDIDTDNNVHITFVSNRVNLTYKNVDYCILYSDKTKSTIKEVTLYTNWDAINPKIAVGTDGKVRILFESLEYDGVNKNLKISVLSNMIKEDEIFVTTSTTYHNTQADMTIDGVNRCHLVWLSKRVSANTGVDYCTFSSTNILTGTKTLATGTFTCKAPKVATDYEDIAHVLFHANSINSGLENIMYSFVYADGTVTPATDIAYNSLVNFEYPTISIYGDKATVSFLAGTEGGKIEKLLTNFATTGTYSRIIDSKTKDTQWKSPLYMGSAFANTDITIEYRLSNDAIAWSVWKNKDELITDTTTGRYLEYRITMSTFDPSITPVVDYIGAAYTPSYIEVQSIVKSSTKEVDHIIVVADHVGDVTYQVSRDSGNTFVNATPEQAASLIGTPTFKDVVIKAKIMEGSILKGWAALW